MPENKLVKIITKDSPELLRDLSIVRGDWVLFGKGSLKIELPGYYPSYHDSLPPFLLAQFDKWIDNFKDMDLKPDLKPVYELRLIRKIKKPKEPDKKTKESNEDLEVLLMSALGIIQLFKPEQAGDILVPNVRFTTPGTYYLESAYTGRDAIARVLLTAKDMRMYLSEFGFQVH